MKLIKICSDGYIYFINPAFISHVHKSQDGSACVYLDNGVNFELSVEEWNILYAKLQPAL